MTYTSSDYDAQVEAIRAYNQPILDEFRAWLEQSGLAEKTVKAHVDNIDFFTEYLVYYEPLEKLDEADGGDIWMFLSDWFPRKAMWSEVARELAEKSVKMRSPDFTLDQLIEQEDLFHNGIQLMEAGKWEEAEQAFRASIAMGDCLPQPWGNMGIALLMQERYDEAEAAFKRALVIEPDYTLAKRNLAALPETRLNGPPPMVGITEPFKGSKLKQSITFFKE